MEDEESPGKDESDKEVSDDEKDEDEAVIEDASDDKSETEKKEKKTKKVLIDEWMHLNPLPLVWLRYCTSLSLQFRRAYPDRNFQRS